MTVESRDKGMFASIKEMDGSASLSPLVSPEDAVT